MEWYINWVSQNPLWSAAVQFAILGTIGEIISSTIKEGKFAFPASKIGMLGKVIAWAILGVVIKYGFKGMKGFTKELLKYNMLPSFSNEGIGWAFSLSTLTNIFFGPQMMLFHRIEDSLIERNWNFKGIKKAWATLLWFWIPAHTVTFSLPREYQIGLAALWSLVLGVIMGITKTKKKG